MYLDFTIYDIIVFKKLEYLYYFKRLSNCLEVIMILCSFGENIEGFSGDRWVRYLITKSYGGFFSCCVLFVILLVVIFIRNFW